MYGHVITKFSRMGSLQHFFTHGAPLLFLFFLKRYFLFFSQSSGVFAIKNEKALRRMW